MVMVGVNQVSHCHSMMAVSSWRVMLLAVGKEGVVDLRGRHLHLVILTLAVQESVELGQATEGQGVGDRGLGVFGQLLGLVACVVTVAGDQEAGEEGAEDEGDQNTGDQESVMDTVIGLVQLWWTPHTFKREKDREEVLELEPFSQSHKKTQTHRHIFKS